MTTGKDENKQVSTEVQAAKPSSQNTLKTKHKDLWRWALSHKKLSIPIAVVVVFAIVLAVPFTRYTVLGLFLKQQYSVVVLDAQTSKPVSSATVAFGDTKVTTDSAGKASAKIPVGDMSLAVTKQYYQSFAKKVVVPIGKQKEAQPVKLTATGRQVPISVVNTISGKPVRGAVLSVAKTQARTDSKGQAVIVVPAGSAHLDGTIKAQGFNDAAVKLTITAPTASANTFKVTPSGKVYFLSNQSGKLDVVKTNLDGTDRKVVVAGTGNEVKPETALLASRDWKYLALLSKRDGGKSAKLFLINTADDTLSVMDEGDAAFELVGWEDHRFVYTVTRSAVKDWQPHKQALKTFDATNKKLATLDQTAGEGESQYDFVREQFSAVYAREGRLLYAKNWTGGFANSFPGYVRDVSSKQVSFNSVKLDGSDKKVLKTFTLNPAAQTTYLGLDVRPYGANELYLAWQETYFEYEEGKVKDVPSMTSEKFYNTEYATYLVSPSGTSTFWTLDRDGKWVFLVGDADGKNEKAVATLSLDYQIYGWYTDDYLLVSKKGSELMVFPVSGATESQLLKIADYYRPAYRFFGYGGGYGGL